MTNFKPTPLMITWAVVATRLLTASPTKISRHCKRDYGLNCSRQSWYDWQEMEGFKDWFYAHYKRMRQLLVVELDEIGLDQARKGSFKHWEAMCRKIEGLP